MTLKVISDIYIEAGESLSNGVDLTEGPLVRLTMSEHWTPANISFQISSDGELYNNLVGMDGQEKVMAVTAGSAVVLAQLGDALKAVQFLKIRSGTSTNPVPQEERRSFAVAIDLAP
jgi:hypothetical protein